MSYKVAVRNPFEGLDDENEDPKRRAPKPKMAPAEKTSDAPKTVKAKAEAPVGSAPAAPATSAAVAKPADGQKKKPASQNSGPRREGNSGPRRDPNSAPVPRNDNRDNAPRPARDQTDKPYERRGRGPREGGAPRRGREFDRRSGTGRPPTENKKGGSGAGNWGDETKEGIVAAEAKAEAAVDSPAGERDAAEVVSEEKKDEAPKEPEGISYDEYIAKKAAPTAETLKIRAAGEGVADNKAWNGYTALSKASDEAPAKKAASTKETQDAKEKDITAGLLNFRIARDDGDRYEGGRGGRGGRGRGSFRGSRGRGGRGDHGGRGRGNAGSSAPAFDPTNFPSLATPQ